MPLTEAVIEAIAAAAEAEPTDLSPMYEAIDGDALEQLFGHRTDDAGSPGNVRGLTVDGWNVFVRGDGHIRVCDPSGLANLSPIFG